MIDSTGIAAYCHMALVVDYAKVRRIERRMKDEG
jgi:hypothetical protein